MDLDDYPTYSDTLSDMLKNNNSNIQCCHGYPNSFENYRMTTWVDKKTWDIFENTLPEAMKWIKCPRNTVFNSYQMAHDLEYDNKNLNPTEEEYD